jgi:hypothetical protein
MTEAETRRGDSCSTNGPALATGGIPSAPSSSSPLPIAPTNITLTLPELKRRLRAHLRDSGVVETILAQLRASLLLSDSDSLEAGAGHHHHQHEVQWRRKAEALQARVKELQAQQQQQQQQPNQSPAVAAAAAAAAAAKVEKAVEERVKRECEARLRQEMEQGIHLDPRQGKGGQDKHTLVNGLINGLTLSSSFGTEMAHFRATELSHLRLEEAAKHRREQMILREELQLECNRRVER